MYDPLRLSLIVLVSAAVATMTRLTLRVPLKQALGEGAFVGYLCALLYLVTFPLRHIAPSEARQLSASINLIPFHTISQLVSEHGQRFVVELLGNLAAFVPLGILLPALGGRFRRLATVLLAALALSVTVEALQAGLRLASVSGRSFDIDDVMLNVVGTGLGYLVLASVRRVIGRPAPVSKAEEPSA